MQAYEGQIHMQDSVLPCTIVVCYGATVDCRHTRAGKKSNFIVGTVEMDSIENISLDF